MTDEPGRLHSPFPFALLCDLADSSTRMKITAEIAARLPRSDHELKDVIRQGLMNRIPGFRNPLAAPAHLLARELTHFAFEIGSTSRDLLRFWIEGREELRRMLDDFLGAARRDLPALRLGEGSTEQWAADDLLALADVYLTEHPGGERREVAVALGMRLWERTLRSEHEAWQRQADGQGDPEPVDDDEDTEGAEEAAFALYDAVEDLLCGPPPAIQTPRLVQIVEEFEALPGDAPEWQEMPAFVARLLGAAGLAKERLDDERTRLRERLAALPGRHATALEYAELSTGFLAGPIDVATAPIPELTTLCDRVEDLLAQLATAREDWPRRHSAAQERQAAVDRLVAEVRLALEQMERAVVPPPPRPPEGGRRDAGSEESDHDGASATTATAVEPILAPQETPARETSAAMAPASDGATAGEFGHAASGEATAVMEESGPAQAVEGPAPSAVAEAPARETLQPAIEQPVSDTGRQPAPVDTDTPETWTSLAWALIAEDDLAGAYWLIRALREHGIDPGVHENIVKAGLGVQFLTSSGTDLALELMDVVHGATSSSDADTLLAHGVALRGALVDPSVFARWLAPVSAVRPLQEVLEPIRHFGVPLHPEALVDLGGAVRREDAIRELADEVRDWLRRAEHRTTKAVRATSVWQQLVRRDLTDLLKPITDNQRNRVAALRVDLGHWQERRHVTERIHAIDGELGGLRRSPLTGDPRDQIVHRVAEVCALAARWCDLVETPRTGAAVPGADRARALRERLARAVPDAERALGGMVESEASRPMAAAARSTLRALAAVRRVLNLGDGPRIGSGFDNALLWKLSGGASVRSALGARLLWLPEVTFVPDGEAPPDQALWSIATALRQSVAEQRRLATALDGWIRRRDFRFAEIIAGVLGESAGPAAGADRLAGEIERAREGLSGQVLETQAAIEQAAVDGLIPDDARAEYTAAAAIDVNAVLDFSAQQERLASIRRSIDEVRNQRVRDQRAEFERLDARLAASPQAEAWKERRPFVLARLDRAHTRVADECLAAMREAAEHGAALPAWVMPPGDAGNALETFLAQAPALGRLKGIPGKDEWPAELAPLNATMAGREQDVERLWGAWLTVKRGGSESDIRSALETLMFGLGFQISNDVDRVHLVRNVEDWVEARVKMSTRTPPPAPQFGSHVTGPFEVLCVWKKAGTDALRTRLLERSRQQQPLLVLYFAALSASERRQAARLVPGRPILLLDEPLVLFLALRGGGLADLFACTLPYTRIVPYTTAGKVPPELFQGREKILEQLEDRNGSCLLYGGRQLGKSALLHHVAHRLHDPLRGSHAVVEDIQNVGNPLAGLPASSVWGVIRTALQSMAPFADRTLATSTEQLGRQIADVLARHRDARVTIGLDEADYFLAADAATEFTELARLRALMTRTERRFRVILAGARTAQKFQGIPNQPLAHLGPAQVVGPLESDAALRLILEPLTAFGVRFTEESDPLRILAFTNYHPALIQFVCTEVLNTLSPTAEPPYRIGLHDLRRVFRQVEVRVRERFEWTLALDRRYECIALAMIADQGRSSPSYGRAYSAREALDLVLGFWPEGFRDVAHNDLRSTLDEMEGLGVLVRTGEGRHRLRSPNVVRLLGSIDDIEHRLLQFAGRPAQTLEADRHRPLLRQATGQCSVLTQGQERLVVTPRFGVGVIFGSRALGLDAAEDSILRATLGTGPLDDPDRGGPRKEITRIPDDVRSGEALTAWLQAHMRDHVPTKGEIVVQPVRGADPVLPERVAAAIRFVRHPPPHKARHWIRVAFLIDPAALWYWLRLPVADRDRLDRGLDFAFALERWDRGALQMRVEHGRDLVAPERAKDALLRVTGGWPLLVDEVMQRCSPRGELQTAVAAVEAELQASEGGLRRAFVEGLGLDGAPLGRAVVDLVRDYDRDSPRIPSSDPELVHLLDQPVTPEEFLGVVDHLVRLEVLTESGGFITLDPVVARLLPRR